MRMLNQLFFRVSCATLLSFLVVSCASFPNVNDDPSKNNEVTYNKDMKDCKEDYPEAGSGVHIKQWISCMNLKGWK